MHAVQDPVNEIRSNSYRLGLFMVFATNTIANIHEIFIESTCHLSHTVSAPSSALQFCPAERLVLGQTEVRVFPV